MWIMQETDIFSDRVQKYAWVVEDSFKMQDGTMDLHLQNTIGFIDLIW